MFLYVIISTHVICSELTNMQGFNKKKIKHMYLSLGLAKNSLKKFLLGKIFDLEGRYLFTHCHI